MQKVKQGSVAVVLVASFIALSIALAQWAPAPLGIDWRLTYRPAALAMFRGENPFDLSVAPEAPFFAAPWGLLPLLPVAFLPPETGRGMIMLGGFAVFAVAAIRLGAKPPALSLFLLSPPVLHCIVNANIEWLTVVGFIMPPQIGLFFVTVKPQTGFAVAVFWLFEAWRAGGLRRVVVVFSPIAVAYLVSFWLYGLWPLRLGSVLIYGQTFNASLWPLSIPVGLTLLVTAIQQRRVVWAMPASPCLSPYVLFHSWSAALAALVRRPLQLLAAIVGLWLVVLVELMR